MSAARPYAVLAMLLMAMPLAHGFAQTQGDAETPVQSISSGSAAIGAFYDLCAAPFPDETDFLNGMAANGYGFASKPSAKLPHRWISGRAKLVYADEKMMQAAGQPAPQCILDAIVTGDDDHLALARRIESKLLIDSGKSQGRGGVNRTIWNYFDNAGNKLRVFFQSRPSKGNTLSMRLTLLRLAAPSDDLATDQAEQAKPDSRKEPETGADNIISEPQSNEENEVSL